MQLGWEVGISRKDFNMMEISECKWQSTAQLVGLQLGPKQMPKNNNQMAKL